jgi:hypothetical protein
VAVDAVHPDDRRVVGGIVVDHYPASNPQNIRPGQSKGWNRGFPKPRADAKIILVPR